MTPRKARKTARQLYRFCLVDGRPDPHRVRLVATRLSGPARRGSLAILTAFQRLVRLDHERHRALVESASLLPDAVRDSLSADLTRRYGSLETSFAENPALIGGVRVKVGSDVYDGSVRARLAAIEASF